MYSTTSENRDSARASPVSDAPHPRPSMRVTSRQGLPQNRRLGINKQVEGRRSVRFLTVNLGSMTGKSREVANMLKRRRVSIACVQETKWKGSKAKEIGEGYKMYYFGTSNNRNGVAVILERVWHDKILKVDRISDRIIDVKLAYGNSILNVISAYAPQVGCPHEEMRQFYEHLGQIMRNIKPEEEIIIGADLNGHVGRDRSGFEQEHL